MRRNPTALLVSVDASLVEAVQGVIDSIEDLDLVIARGATEAHQDVAREDVAVVLVHQDCLGEVDDVTRLLRVIAEAKRSLPTIVLSDSHRPDQALEMLRTGAADYLCRPLDLGRLTYLIEVLTLRARLALQGLMPGVRLRAETIPWTERPAPRINHSGAPIDRMMEQVRRVAALDTTILLGGETGTGKTRLARIIHELSPRRDLPFLAVNCGALSPTLIESELFGHVKGAFTGADRDHAGKFAEVGGGTLLLDEIDALPPPLQAKLLRAVEERVFEPVGSNSSLPVQARLIAASNRSLDHEAAAGRFRSDLFYRLNVVSFTLPPLRQRRDAIAHFANEFVAEFASRNRRPVRGISPGAMRAMQAYSWPGNIRELRNLIERAIALSGGIEIELDDLPEQFQPGGTPLVIPLPVPTGAALRPAGSPLPTLARTKDDAERFRITDALQRHQNNRLRAAAELGISRMTLYKKLHKYGMMGSA
jgi:two-component system response regulator HydG